MPTLIRRAELTQRRPKAGMRGQLAKHRRGSLTPPAWTYYFARRFSASRFELVMRVFYSAYYRREFGVRLRNNLVVPSGRQHAMYYLAPEWTRFAGRVYRRACADLATFRRYIRLIRTTQRAALIKTRQAVSRPLRRQSWVSLGRAWEHWDEAHFDHFLKPIWIPFTTEPLLARDATAVIRRLVKRRHCPERETEVLDTVFSPDQMNAITEERLAFLRLALRVADGRLRGRGVERALRAHTQQFGFIPCYDVIDHPWGTDHFRTELRTLLRSDPAVLRRELHDLTTKFKVRQRTFRQLLTELRPVKRERELLIMAHELAFIKDERDDYRRRLSFTARPLFLELARRWRLPNRAPSYLLAGEMRAWFATGRLPIPRTRLLERLKGYALARVDDSEPAIFSGRRLHLFLKRVHLKSESQGQAFVRGIVGNGGHVRGIARLVRTKHDLRRVKTGDVLVSVTTNPDYVPAMRKCIAFVTDEGGITSHAAIVAREMKKPCIIGTKVATQVFKDGDRVEVNADLGTVKKV